MRLIDADAIEYVQSEDGYQNDYAYRYDINEMPTVDAAPVVRCRECKYAHLTYDGDIKYCDLLAVKDEYGDCDPCFYRSGDWFCADGKRKEKAE